MGKETRERTQLKKWKVGGPSCTSPAPTPEPCTYAPAPCSAPRSPAPSCCCTPAPPARPCLALCAPAIMPPARLHALLPARLQPPLPKPRSALITPPLPELICTHHLCPNRAIPG
ncbi:hypothetical protein SLEP1_g9434 [Rubroshorea leprosula]|uniref:Uncharacterized protein n=1 Tax=Rubroshorea leprosula TaxID=152421 RepID=A0AAV5IE80_9ROSI|nr:hypothetical protein SLEP1_g9434 [Rubroshorea leprosula]